jgi:hypothetical protein
VRERQRGIRNRTWIYVGMVVVLVAVAEVVVVEPDVGSPLNRAGYR